MHSSTWVPRPVRELARKGLVIGGHPGLTQYYRGGYSSFHAVLQGRLDLIGWTVFHVDQGVDTGDVIAQGRIAPEPGDSFLSLDWRAMIEIAEQQAWVVQNLDRGIEPPRQPLGLAKDDTLYGYPTLSQYLRYKLKQSRVR